MFRAAMIWLTLTMAIVLVSSTPLAAQDFTEAAPAAAAETYTPLTAAQDYAWTIHQIVDPTRLFIIGTRAAIDHAGDDPNKWGQGAEGYAVRVASRLGRVAVRENLAFGIRRLDHEDPRYVRADSRGVLNRTRHAVTQTFIARNREGGIMPAYSSLAADFATPFIAQTWHPGTIRGARELQSGGMAIGVTAFSNICSEFWPDIRKRLRR